MRLIFLVTLLGAACVFSFALPVRDERETSEEELLQEKSDENLLSALESAPEVSEQQQQDSSSSEVSEPNGNDVDSEPETDRISSSSVEEQRHKRLVADLQIKDESNSFSREIDDKTILKRSLDLRERTKAEFDFIGTRIGKRIQSKESSEEDNTVERLRRSLQPVNADDSNSNSDSHSHERHQPHDELRGRYKRGGKDSSSDEDSSQKKDKNTSEDSSEEKKKPAHLQPLAAEETKPKDGEEIQALRRKRHVDQSHSFEAKSSGQKELSEELSELETADDDLIQKDTQDEVENSEETTYNATPLENSIENTEPKINSVEDYVQGCEVMEPDSNEANETTYITDKR